MLDELFEGDISEKSDHRPWPIPSGPWLLFQRWSDLLFMHWPVNATTLAEQLPEPIRPYLDFYKGQAWLSIASFYLSHQRIRGMPQFPGVSEFPEINVRTYVTCKGKPGVYFFSLDAGNALAVLGAQIGLNLPYHRADMTFSSEGNETEMISERLSGPEARLSVTYHPTGPVSKPAEGSLAHFLTERYCFYNVIGGTMYRAENHHQPWPLQDATAKVEINTMAAPIGFELGNPPLLHYSKKLDVVFWAPALGT